MTDLKTTLDNNDNDDRTVIPSKDSSPSLMAWLKRIMPNKPEQSLRETLVELIEDSDNADEQEQREHERHLIANILSAAQLSANDVMVPRADIVSIDVSASSEDLLQLLAERPMSRIAVYEETLDNILGSINIKDVLVCLARGERPVLSELVRDAMIVSPALEALDLLLEMRQTKKHLAFVVDEYGGVDGLVTIGDLIEAIVGEFDDEHDEDDDPKLVERADGTILVDARFDIDDMQDLYGTFLSEEEREDVDTLGGLVMTMAGRMPIRGELLKHHSGMEIEVLDADARRVKRLRIHKIPQDLSTLENAGNDQRMD